MLLAAIQLAYCSAKVRTNNVEDDDEDDDDGEEVLRWKGMPHDGDDNDSNKEEFEALKRRYFVWCINNGKPVPDFRDDEDSDDLGEDEDSDDPNDYLIPAEDDSDDPDDHSKF